MLDIRNVFDIKYTIDEDRAIDLIIYDTDDTLLDLTGATEIVFTVRDNKADETNIFKASLTVLACCTMA